MSSTGFGTLGVGALFLCLFLIRGDHLILGGLAGLVSFVFMYRSLTG